MDKAERVGKLARQYAREEGYAEQEILRIRLAIRPRGTLLGRRGCDTSRTLTCCYRQTDDDATQCVYCKRNAPPEEYYEAAEM